MEDKSVSIGTNIGSSIVSGNAKNVTSKADIRDSLNSYTVQQQKTLAEAAAEIQLLLEQVSETYSTDTEVGRMKVATEVITRIENNENLLHRILSALRVGSISAFEQLLNHPAASFVIGVLQDWQSTKGL